MIFECGLALEGFSPLCVSYHIKGMSYRLRRSGLALCCSWIDAGVHGVELSMQQHT